MKVVKMCGTHSSNNNLSSGPSLHERVAQGYYSHGLFCSSYPFTITFLALSVAALCCFPLANIPMPGTVPQQIVWPKNDTDLNGPKWDLPYAWAKLPPKVFVQQIILRAAVYPWNEELILTDAFRGPLYESFKILDIVRNHQDEFSGKTLGDLCLHVESTQSRKKDFMPEYTCLLLSPSNLWQNNAQKFSEDASILGTVYSHQHLQKGKTSLAEILFGMQLKDTGIKRYPIRTRLRIMQYAVTIIFQEYDHSFIKSLKQKLMHTYPLHSSDSSNENKTDDNDVLHIYYPGELNYYEFIQLMIAFLILFFYIYFSVRKIELVKSKAGMAFVACITVFLCLCMSVGICFFFGLTLSLQGKEVFPYLIILIGLENVIVLTKSILSTPSHLDVKIRVARGLSKEGWSITKNLLIEVTILTFGLFTFIPAIQEFSIFAIVGLISDFFLQMLFFTSFLALDIRRMTSSIVRNTTFKSNGLHRSKSQPTFHIVAPNTPTEKKIPKRLRLVHIWARTRFFQRGFMIWMVVWISLLLYDTGFIENFTEPKAVQKNFTVTTETNYKMLLPSSDVKYEVNSSSVDKLRHFDLLLTRKLSNYHWPAIFNAYNLSLKSNYITLLPSIRISHIVTPETALLLRHPDDRTAINHFQWSALAAVLDPFDFTDETGVNPNTLISNSKAGLTFPENITPYYPTSPMEIMFTTILCFISVVVLAYGVFVLYKCICTRNYAEWRASWASDQIGNENKQSSTQQLIMEAVPTILDGHTEQIECLAADGCFVVSTCLLGEIRVWDINTAELQSVINRKHHFGFTNHQRNSTGGMEYSTKSESPPLRSPTSLNHHEIPALQRKINCNFKQTSTPPINSKQSGFNFTTTYNKLFLDRVEDLSAESVQQNKSEKSERTSFQSDSLESEDAEQLTGLPPIWCLDYVDNLIVLGCADGRIEFWEGSTANFKCLFDDGSGIGITSIKIIANRVISAKINGSLDFLQLQSYTQGRYIDWNFRSAYRRTHIRTGSTGSLDQHRGEDLQCIRLYTTKAHQQPITVLDSEGGRVVTGSQDHLLKVFRLEDQVALYTLHGHHGPITALFIDRVSPMMSGSGSQDGGLCVWDLLTGTCMFSIQAHDGAVISLTYSASYVISLGGDDRLCVWERFQGHLLNTLQVTQSYAQSMVMLTESLLVTGCQGSLSAWDVRTGDTIRKVTLGNQDNCVFVKQVIHLSDESNSIVCDYGAELRIVRFPLLHDKYQ